MKITHLTTLKHKLQWLVLLAALLGVSQGVWAETQSLFSIRVYYNKSEHFYNVSRWSSTCTNPGNNPCNTDQTSWVSSNGTTNLGEVTGHIYLRGYIWLDYTDERSNGYVSWKTDNGSFTQKNMSKKGDYNNWCSNNWYRYETDSGSDFDINTDNLTPGEHTIEFYARSPWYNNDAYHNNDGNNYKIKFTVPEPAATFAEGDVIWLDIRHSNGGWGQETGELMYVNLNPGDNTITRAMTKVAQADNTVKNSLWVYRFTAADAALNKSEIKFQRGNASDGRWNKSTGLSASDLSSNNGIYIDDSTWDGAGKKFNFTTSNNIVSTPTLTMKDNAGSSTISSCTSGETVKFYESTQTITTTISGTSKARTLVNPLYTYTFSKGSYSSGQTIDNPHSWTTGDTYLGSGTAKVKITFAIDGSSTPASSISSGYEKESSGTSFTVNSSCTNPTPTTANTPSAKGTTTATLTGTYPTTSGYCSITEKGICYGTSSNPTSEHKDNTSGSGSISHSATGLSEGTTYYYRAYVKSGGSTLYGANKSFKTKCTATKPTLSATPPNATNITCSSATLGGQVTNKGQDASCETLSLTYRGVKVYSNSACTDAYLVTTVNHATPDSTDPYTVTVPSGTLSSGTTYYYKSYATNATETSYSTNYKSFTTKSSVTSVTTGGASSLTLNTGDSEAITSNTTYSMTVSPSGAGDYWSFSVSPTPFTGANTITNATGSTSSNINFRREGQYTVTGGAGCGSTDETGTFTVNVSPGTLYVAGPLIKSTDSWTVNTSTQTMTKTGSGTSSVYTYEWTAPSDFVAGSESVTGGEFTVQSVTNMSLPNYILPAYCPADPSTYTNIYRVTNTANHNLRNTFAVSSGDKLKLTISYHGATGTPKAPYYTFTLNKVPVPTTDEPDNITWTQAKLWGTYPKTSEYASISTSESGFYYGTTSSPATKVYNGSQTAGRLAKTIKNLTPGTTYYYKAFVVSGGVEYYGSVESFTTTACSNPTVSTQPSDTDREYCINDASPATLTVEATGGVGAYTYQWKQCATSGGTYTNVSAGSGGTTATYTPSTATAGELYYKCVVTNSGICTSNSVTSNASGKYTIDATSVAGTISGGSAEQCLGATKTLTLGSYTGTIQWHVGNTSDFTPSSSTAISGATNSTYKAPINEVGTKYYKAVVTNGVCPSATTVTAADITVNRKYQASDFNLSGNTQDYDGNPKTVTVAEKSGAGNGAITIKYAGSTTAPTNAGTYAITIDVDKSSTSPYYCAEEGLSIGTLTINQIDQPTPVTIDNETTSYCVSTLGTDIPLEASGGDGTGAYSFTITGGTVAADKREIRGSTLTVSGAGTVILQAKRDADTNYNAKNSATVTFTFTANGPKVFTLTNEGATALCGKGDGSSTGTGGSLRLTGSESGYSYQLKKDDANYGVPVEGTGSALTFPVTSSGVYTCTAYYGVDPSQCPTEMNVEDGGIVLVVNITPRLLPGTPTVRQYQAITITSTNTEIDKWVLSGEGADAYTYDSTPNSITLKANTAGSPYRLIATTSAGCTATAVITVIADTENCVP